MTSSHRKWHHYGGKTSAQLLIIINNNGFDSFCDVFVILVALSDSETFNPVW